MAIISVVNNKGGVGKTTTTVNLAHALANKGKRVLVIDHDPQSNTSSILAPSQTEHPNTLFELYTEGINVSDCVYPTLYDGVSVLPNTGDTATLEIGFYQDMVNSYTKLRDAVRDYALQNFDVTLIDAPPNLGMFLIQPLMTSDCAIIPIEAGCRYSLDGFTAAYDAIQAINKRVEHDLKFLKALINKVDLRATLSKNSVALIRKQYGDKVFETTIPINTDLPKAVAAGETVIRFAPHSTGAKRFRALADELIRVLDQ